MENRIKILFLIDGLRIGGKERRILELLKILVNSEEYQIIVYSTRREILYKEFFNLNLPIFYIVKSESSFISTAKQLKKGIQSFKPDIIHSWSSYAATLAVVVKFIGADSFKLVNSQITNVPPKIKVFTREWFQNRINFFFSDIILSNTLKGIEKYNSPRKKTHCIYNGFDFIRNDNLENIDKIKSKYHLKKEFIIGMIGAMEKKKDFACYVNSAITLLKERDDIFFFVIGDGSMRKKIESIVPNSYKNKIVFTGNMQRVENIIQLFDIGVLCTNSKVHGEGISNVILEIMAQGKPVIATEGGGTSEIVLDKQNGVIIPSGDEEKFSKNIEQLLLDDSYRKSLGKKARETVVEKFDNTMNNAKYCKLYKGLVYNKKGEFTNR